MGSMGQNVGVWFPELASGVSGHYRVLDSEAMLCAVPLYR